MEKIDIWNWNELYINIIPDGEVWCLKITLDDKSIISHGENNSQKSFLTF